MKLLDSLFLFAAVAGALAAEAQLADSATCVCEHRSAVSGIVWWGSAPTSRHLWLGGIEDAGLSELGIGLVWSHPVARAVAIEAAMTVLPYIRFTRPGAYAITERNGGIVNFSPTPRATGLGLIPLDVGIRGFTRSRVSASAGAFFGFVWFDRPIPNSSAEKKSYLFGLRTGLEYSLNDRNQLFVGARGQHMSNGSAHHSNEGVESVMFRLGYGFKVRR